MFLCPELFVLLSDESGREVGQLLSGVQRTGPGSVSKQKLKWPRRLGCDIFSIISEIAKYRLNLLSRCIEKFLASFGALWRVLAKLCCIEKFLASFGEFWRIMASFGALWRDWILRPLSHFWHAS